jgi:hypothetical protein
VRSLPEEKLVFADLGQPQAAPAPAYVPPPLAPAPVPQIKSAPLAPRPLVTVIDGDHIVSGQ